MKVKFGPWAPDLPALDNPGALKATNVIPARGSYRPLSGLSVYSSALTARCQGAYGTQDSAGNANVFAGDAAKLYRISGSSITWGDVSKSGGYTTVAEEHWNFASYGDRVMATNITDAIQSYVMGTSTDFADLSAAAPKARYITVAKNFTIVANTTDSTDGAMPARVWWSEIGDPTSWPTPGTSTAIAAQSDHQDLVGDGGWCQGLASGLAGADFAIFQERALWRAVYVGGAGVWQFDPVEGGRGTPAPGSIVQVGGMAFYLGEDGFYRFNGTDSAPIGASLVDKFFFTDLDQEYFHRITAAADPINKVVMWSYPSGQASSGIPDRLILHNWETGGWAYAEITCEMICRSLSLGYDLEDLDDISASIDALPFSLDSRALTGGRLLLSAFDADHKLNYFTGANLAATIDTMEAQPFDGRRAFLNQAWPLVDGGGTLTVTPITRNRQNDALVTGSAVSQNSIGFCPLRVNARYVRLRVGIAAGGDWDHAVGVDIPNDSVRPAGRR